MQQKIKAPTLWKTMQAVEQDALENAKYGDSEYWKGYAMCARHVIHALEHWFAGVGKMLSEP